MAISNNFAVIATIIYKTICSFDAGDIKYESREGLPERETNIKKWNGFPIRVMSFS